MNSSTSISKRWLLLFLAALLSTAGIGWLYASHLEPETQFWVSVFEKRRAEMATRSPAPHLLFTGDSACSFGIDARAITAATGIPAYNLGGTRQMGLRVFLDEALGQAQKGDTLILICNPDLLIEDPRTRATKAGAQMALALPRNSTFPEKIQASRPGFNHLMTLGAKLALGLPPFPYHLSGYQPLGQITTEIRATQTGRDKPLQKTKADVTAASNTLTLWNERCRAKGVTLTYLLPLELTHPDSLTENRNAKNLFLEKLADQNHGVTLITTPASGCSADPTLFADTLFHLTAAGAAQFSQDLALRIPR